MSHGKFLEQHSPKATNNIFESVRIMLQEGTVDRKSQKKIEKLIKTRRKDILVQNSGRWPGPSRKSRSHYS